MIKRGSLVLVEAWGKRRPAIVLAMHADGTLAIIVGTTKPPREGDPAAIKVEPFTREGRALQLHVTTYFKRAGVGNVALQACTECRGSCPSGLQVVLEQMIDTGLTR